MFRIFKGVIYVYVRVNVGGKFREGSTKADRTKSHVQEKNGKDTRLLEVLPSNSTREWNIGSHRPL